MEGGFIKHEAVCTDKLLLIHGGFVLLSTQVCAVLIEK